MLQHERPQFCMVDTELELLQFLDRTVNGQRVVREAVQAVAFHWKRIAQGEASQIVQQTGGCHDTRRETSIILMQPVIICQTMRNLGRHRSVPDQSSLCWAFRSISGRS